MHSYYAPTTPQPPPRPSRQPFPILRAANIPAASRAARWLTDRVAASGRALYPAGVVSVGGTLSPALEAALRYSRESQIMPVARLRRTAVHSTRPPANQDARAGRLPTALWPEWALRLTPRHLSGRPAAQRADELLAVACLLAGNTTSVQATTHLTGTTVTSHNVSTLLAEVTRRSDCTDVLHALILLADHLDGAPIDYARRRALFTSRPSFIDARAWLDLQRRLRSNHQPRRRARPALDLPRPDGLATAPRPPRPRSRHPGAAPAVPALPVADPARRSRPAHPHRARAPRRARHHRTPPVDTPAP
ncbi:hypothetical protein AB0M39_42190, partial [Streptomyces sp. NPDC051907]|uniref:hypothetical protein n=1 Tax=Streptomyces sp. NPDC051907 TaxID=3155284 RepID=UPI00343117BB